MYVRVKTAFSIQLKMSSKLKIIIFAIYTLLAEVISLNVYTCGSVVQNEKQFLIQSDYSLQQYQPDQTCEFILNSDPNCDNKFHFQFLLFDIENSLGCSKDRLEISDTDAICGIKNGFKEYQSKNGVLQLKFITDSSNFGRGFKILITKLPCSSQIQQSCCADKYNLRRFYISSPEFPYANPRSDCIYKIFRANPNICRLRIHFIFYSNGLYYNCNEAHLEIDGKKFCGCKTGLNIISKFDKTWGNSPKIIKYVSDGNNGYFKGFILEVIQDECPDKYLPEEKIQVPQFYYYNDQLNKVDNTNNDANLIVHNETESNSTLMMVKRNAQYHYYFYRAPDDDDFIETKEKEPRNYYDTEQDDIPFSNYDSTCQNWGVNEFTEISESYLWKQMSQCRPKRESTCCIIDMKSGYLYSPGFPFYYGRNLDICYRFQRKNSCGFNVFVIEFDVENSQYCLKDAVVIYDQRYCGNSLLRSQFTIDLSNKESEDILFKSDSSYCARGFQLYFQQIPCTPTNLSCGGEIDDMNFEVDIPRIQGCGYNIRKYQPDVCRLQLLFNFDLVCGLEYLLINNKQYCGRHQGNNETIEFVQTDVIGLSYHSATMSPVMSSVHVRGRQVASDCRDEHSPPPAQLRSDA